MSQQHCWAWQRIGGPKLEIQCSRQRTRARLVDVDGAVEGSETVKSFARFEGRRSQGELVRAMSAHSTRRLPALYPEKIA
ncbi:hypothetical protein FOMPIDRAFT_1021563 [Fomitopsis schrenkii]|uniref:Uncharacterized protein n=1 Tax=Fomitopsis schrenkii TaxID=2126942 RepID=S8FW12_FOMSC|nr:hypothetical protein FOMPIDRAFT_1021563 [Fomitopsis schrenkii]